MKFTDGYWHYRSGMMPYFPVHVHDIDVEPEALIVYGTVKRLTHRGDTINTGLLTVRFSSPLPDVIRVQMVHHKGQRPSRPAFVLYNQPLPEVSIKNEEDQASLTSGTLAVRVDKGEEWLVEYTNHLQLLTHSGWRGMGYVDTASGSRFIHEQLGLSVGETIYGLGERFTPFVKNGQVVDLWNEDGGTSSEQAYKNIPFYLSNRGYGVFINHPERVSLEIGSEKVMRVQFSVPGETLDYFIINGPTPKEVLMRYTALTGRPALPPAWWLR